MGENERENRQEKAMREMQGGKKEDKLEGRGKQRYNRLRKLVAKQKGRKCKTDTAERQNGVELLTERKGLKDQQ